MSIRARCAQVTVAVAIAGASVLAGCSGDDAAQVTYAEIIVGGTPGESDRLEAIDQFVKGDVDPSDVAAPEDVAVLLAVNHLYESRVLRSAIVAGAIEDGDLTRGGLRTQFANVEDPDERDRAVEMFMGELETDGVEVSAKTFFFLPALSIYAIEVRNAALRLDS